MKREEKLRLKDGGVACILPNDVAAGGQVVVGHWGAKVSSQGSNQSEKAKAKLTSQAGVRDKVGETHCERREWM